MDVCWGLGLVVADYYANGGTFPSLSSTLTLPELNLLHVFALELKEVGVEVPTA
jgi:hypothetical protein